MSKPSTAEWIVNNLLTNWLYFLGEEPAIPALWVKGECPLYLVLGENAGGKSFFRRCVYACMKRDTSIQDSVHLSMEGRSSASSVAPFRSLIYGDEEMRSTGENSTHTVSAAIRTCQSREEPHLLYWDEPDLGMSEGAAMGTAIAIAEFMKELPAHTKGVFVTTHSRAMVQQFLQEGLVPHYIHLGIEVVKAPPTLGAWLERDILPIPPEETKKASIARRRAIQKILNDREENKS